MTAWQRVVRFALVGALNTAVYYLIYLPTLLVLLYLPAHVVAWAISFVVSFFANCRFTYHVRPTWRRFLRYPWSAVAQVVSTSAGVVALVDWWHMSERLAPLVAGVLVIPITYLAASYALRGPVSGDPPGTGRWPE